MSLTKKKLIIETNVKQSKTASRAKKVLSSVFFAIFAVTTMSITAFADGAAAELPAFFEDAINVLQTVVILIGGGVGVWGVINLLEGYGNDNPGAKSQGMKQLMAGVGIALIGILLIPNLTSLFG